MSNPANTATPKLALSFSAVFRGLCPSCHKGRVLRGIFSIHRRCSECGYDFNPENGFYLGAMAISYLATAILTVPPLIFLKVMGASLPVLMAFPLVEFIFLGTFLMIYARVLWLHLEYRMTGRLGDAGRTRARPNEIPRG